MDRGALLSHSPQRVGDSDRDGVPAGGGLLPTNTQVFASTALHWTWMGVSPLVLCALLGVILMAVAGGMAQGPAATRKAIAGAGAAFLAAAVMAAFAGRAYLQRQLAAARDRGEWHDGVIVFPSGDIVLRFGGLAGRDVTIEAPYVSRADVERGCTWRACPCPRSDTWLRIYYLRLDASPACASVAQSELAHSVADVAACINEVKARTPGLF
jgi:hypothetical protein